jgi:MFS family permease
VLAARVLVLAALVAGERRISSPMIDVSLFRNPRFTAASASVAIAFFALPGFIFLMTQYFQVVRAYSPLATGVRLLPVAVSVAGTRLAVRIGNKIIVGGGMLLFWAALLWISTDSRFTSYGISAAQMVMLGIGMGFTQAPATEAIMGAVPRQKAGIASAVNGSTRLFGGTLGVAVIGSVAASLYTSQLAALLPSGRRAASRPPGKQVITPPAGRQLLLAPRHSTAKQSQNNPRHHRRPGADDARRLRAARERRGTGQSRTDREARVAEHLSPLNSAPGARRLPRTPNRSSARVPSCRSIAPSRKESQHAPTYSCHHAGSNGSRAGS